jgi:protease-4
LLVAGIAGSAERIDQHTLLRGAASQKVAVVPLSGVIDARMLDRFNRFMRQAEGDADVKALVIEIDTPGGEITASDEIHQRIIAWKQAKSGAPVVVAMGSMATSGGYYVSCAADEIWAQPTTLTGNIGVVLFRFNFADMLQKLGVRETSITPLDSAFKNSESMFKPETPETTAYLRGLADDMYARFKKIVETSRGKKLTAPMDEVASGKVFTANEALRMKLIDQVGYTLDASRSAAKLAGLNDPTVVRYRPPVSFFEALAGETTYRGSSGVNIHINAQSFTEAARPRLMYFWDAK